MTPQEEIRQAGDAQHVLDNPVFQKARAEIYEKLRQARKGISTATDPARAADLVRVEQIADQFFDYFELVLQTGKLASAHLAESQQRRSLRERGLAIFQTLGRNTF